MEQPTQTQKTTKRTFTVWHAAALLLILCTAAAVWFGIHPRYRPVAVILLALGAVGAWKRKWLFWIAAAVELGFAGFLWAFPQAGYKLASVVPLTIIVLLFVFRFGKKPLKILASVLLGTALCGLLIAEIPIINAASKRPKPDADYIVVLGAAVYGTEPSITLEHRLEGAVRYLEANSGTKAVVSGGQGEGEEISEAECMRRYLDAHGIEPGRILLEDRSTSTKENLAFSKEIILSDGGDVSRVVLVSSGYHLYRAEKTAALLGIGVEGYAGSDGYPIYMFGMYLREAAAVWKLWVFGA